MAHWLESASASWMTLASVAFELKWAEPARRLSGAQSTSTSGFACVEAIGSGGVDRVYAAGASSGFWMSGRASAR
jgi:hypothetical protein